MRSVPRVLAATTMLVVAATGCAGGDDDPSAGATTTSSAPPTSASPAPQPSRATPVPGDLLDFSCAPAADGKAWTAQGVIVNSAATADYRVTVLVAPPGVTGATAQRLVIPKVETGVETPFSVDTLPANPGTPADCRVQLVRLG